MQESKLMLYLDKKGQYNTDNKCQLSGRGGVIVTKDLNIVEAGGNDVELIYAV